VQVGPATAWACEYVTAPDGGILRVTFVEAGGKIYAIRMLTSAAGGIEVSREELLSDERLFLDTLRW
jgi:hypothetical protein